MNVKEIARNLREVAVDVIETEGTSIVSRWFHAADDVDLLIWTDDEKTIIKYQVSLFGQVVEWNMFDGVKTGVIIEIEEKRKKDEVDNDDESDGDDNGDVATAAAAAAAAAADDDDDDESNRDKQIDRASIGEKRSDRLGEKTTSASEFIRFDSQPQITSIRKVVDLIKNISALSEEDRQILCDNLVLYPQGHTDAGEDFIRRYAKAHRNCGPPRRAPLWRRLLNRLLKTCAHLSNR